MNFLSLFRGLMKELPETKGAFRLFVFLALVLATLSLARTPVVLAATFTVTKTADTNDGTCDSDCSLREAIGAANANPGSDIVTVPAGTYTLTITGSGEDANATGDLDITDDLTIQGSGAGQTIIDAANIDRGFHVIGANTVEFNDLTVQNGSVTQHGGGVFIPTSGASVDVNRSQIKNNTAAGLGGGIRVMSGATLSINDSTISGNQATTYGGGLNGPGNINLYNSTVSGNSASETSAIMIGGSSTTSIEHTTITNNTSTTGGAIGSASAIMTISNSIIAGNPGGDCNIGYPSYTSNGFNIVGDATCAFSNTGDVNSTDPLLGPLQDNGGPTPTHSISAGSPALDQIPNGTNGCATTNTQDQRGATRPTDGDADSTASCDKGAFEAPAMQCGIQTTGEPTVYTFFGNVDLEVDSDGTDLDCLSVSRIDHDHPNAYSNMADADDVYWVIEALQSDQSTAATADFDIDLTLPYASADANDKLCRYVDGTGWTCGATTFSAGVSITWDNRTTFSDWEVGDDVGPTAITMGDAAIHSTEILGWLNGLLILLMGALTLFWFGRRHYRQGDEIER